LSQNRPTLGPTRTRAGDIINRFHNTTTLTTESDTLAQHFIFLPLKYRFLATIARCFLSDSAKIALFDRYLAE
jgi:hypothetical protein